MSSQHDSQNARSFDQFTNRYSLSKTLRFELKPVGNTDGMMKEHGIVKMDEDRKKRYEKTKPFFDKLHQEFINESLNGVMLSALTSYEVVYKQWKADKKNKDSQKQLEKKEKELREEIVQLFDRKASEWVQQLNDEVKIKKQNHEFLFEPGVFAILHKKYGNDPESLYGDKSIFASWDKWTAYFGKFFETRKNFYKSDGTATAVATRVVNDNLRRFYDNLELFRSIKSKLDLSILEKDFNVVTDNVFALDFYHGCLNQSGIDAYNALIGGEVRENGNKIKGINEYINEHRQNTGEKLPRLKKLDKQIGSDKAAFIDLIETDIELQEQLHSFIATTVEKMEKLDSCFAQISNENTNLSGIFLNKVGLNTITRRWFVSSQKISAALVIALNKAGDKSAKFDKKSEEYKLPDFISLQAIKSAIEQMKVDGENIWKESYAKDIAAFPKDVWNQFLAILNYEYAELRDKGHQENGASLKVLQVNLESALNVDDFKRNEIVTDTIKLYSDRVLNIYRLAKYFSLEKSRQWNPDGLELDDFYVDYQEYLSDSFEKIVKVYDKIRNYLTKKPFNTDKWLLNFENSTLAAGWDKNKETDNCAVLLRKNGMYYLGIMSKGNNNVFRDYPAGIAGGYEKLEYKLFPGPSKMMPKVCFSKLGRDSFKPSDEILHIYENEEFKKGDTFSVASMQKLIAFYIEALGSYPGWKMYDFSTVKPATEYTENIGEFYNDVAKCGYIISFNSISDDYIDSLNVEGKLFLFEIRNKDWNTMHDGKKKNSTKNLHTVYFEQVFSEENRRMNFPMKLNGEAEIFFRPATDRDVLGTKKDQKHKNGKDVVVGKRYAEDKYFFHVPLTFNRTAPDVRRFNQSVNELLQNNPEINIIGIDRGEKHLAYLSVINQNGQILEMKSLNKIGERDYAALLQERAKNREQARRDWKSVEQIKDLKKGYISLVVREIADLIIKYNAIVVFEDLNMRFKQVRGGIEKSVYQQLEKALIDKLNFLVNKNEMDPEKAGHVLRAYQLAAPFESFKDMGKQTGIMFYTQAEYTSQTDPVTGFRKNVYMSNSATIDKIQEFIKKIDLIGWDDELKSYYFEYNPINFVDAKFKDGTHSKAWRVYANIPRIKREKINGHWKSTPVNPNDAFIQLFTDWAFDNLHSEDLKDQIFQMESEKRLDGTKELDGKLRNFWQSFVYLFNLVLQVRNSTSTQYVVTHKEGEEKDTVTTIEGVDFISSPVKPFFTTDGGEYTEGRVNVNALGERFIGSKEEKERFLNEFNGDANGAYNIARKGMIILDRITQNPERPDIFIKRVDWDRFAQGK